MSKRKVLICGDSSLIDTGFGIYQREVLSRLHEWGNVEVAEMANFATIQDRGKTPWTFYPTSVESNDPRAERYNSSPENKNGKWRFDPILVTYKPDIVACFLDPWMLSYQCDSAYRDYFRWVIAATHDSGPASPQNVGLYTNADDIFTYTEWAKDELTFLDVELDNVRGYIPMGISPTYSLCDNKEEAKKALGITPDTWVFGTVMRNQARKRIPDLLEAYHFFKKSNPLVKSCLIIHTTYHDGGWNIPFYLNKYGLQNDVYFSYSNGEEYRISKFMGAKNGEWECHSAVSGYPETYLRSLYWAMDLYIQYSYSEGFGVPMYEAAACGTMVAAPAHSGMIDFLRLTQDSSEISYDCTWKEAKTNSEKFVPHNYRFADWITGFVKNRAHLNYIDKRNSEIVKEHNNWDKTAKMWEHHFLNCPLEMYQGQWHAPKRELSTKIDPEEVMYLDNADIIRYYYDKFVPDSPNKYGYKGLQNIEILENGYKQENYNRRHLNAYHIGQGFVNNASTKNLLEQIRVMEKLFEKEDYLL